MKNINEVDVSFNVGNDNYFMYRMAGIALHNDNVLLVTEDQIDYWYTPGGRVSMFEASHDAIKREIYEEFKEEPSIERLLWFTEEMFHHQEFDRSTHALVFYYLVDFSKHSDIYKKESWFEDVFDVEEGKCFRHHFRWFNIHKLNEIKLAPKFLPSKIKKLPSTAEHVVVNELQGY